MLIITNYLLFLLSGIVHDINFIDDENGEIIEQREELSLTSKRSALHDISNNKKWKFTTIQKRHPYLKHRSYVNQWKAQVEMGTVDSVLNILTNF